MDPLNTEQVSSALDRAIQGKSSLSWLTPELDARMVEIVTTATTFRALRLIVAGQSPEDASNAASEMLLPLAFALGVDVGRESEASARFVHQMGGLLDDTDPPDAGLPE